MPGFIKTLKKRLIAESRLKRYLVYAFGEIVLIVCGILVAVQLNNRNAARIQKAEFNLVIEQIYNSIDIDIQIIETEIRNYMQQVELINTLIANADTIADGMLVHILFYLETYSDQFNTETEYHFSNLKYNTGDVKQNELAKEISSFVQNKIWAVRYNTNNSIESIRQILLDAAIPAPNVIFIFSAFNNFSKLNPEYYTTEEIENARSIIQSKAGIAALKTLRSRKENILVSKSNSWEDASSIQQLIREYKPDVRLQYQDIGIIGSALESGYTKSLPMQLTNADSCIWEIETYLQAGALKFRSRNSWAYNWGGNTFPNGETIFFGQDIIVPEGNYRIKINLSSRKYTFIKLDS